MATGITAANLKGSGEIAVGPLFGDKTGASSDTSSEKVGDKGHQSAGLQQGPGVDSDTNHASHAGTFKGDESFYTPIDSYEGKHRYDPTFEWQPKEEKKLVRKVEKAKIEGAVGTRR